MLDRVAPKGGIIAQKIIYKKWKIKHCTDPKKKYSKPDGFFELFALYAGRNESDRDEWGFSEQSCTRGEIKIVGYAKFYSLEQGKDKLRRKFRKFKIDPKFPQNSGGLIDVGRVFFPWGSDSNKLKRTLTAKWNCCEGIKNTEITVE